MTPRRTSTDGMPPLNKGGNASATSARQIPISLIDPGPLFSMSAIAWLQHSMLYALAALWAGPKRQRTKVPESVLLLAVARNEFYEPRV